MQQRESTTDATLLAECVGAIALYDDAYDEVFGVYDDGYVLLERTAAVATSRHFSPYESSALLAISAEFYENFGPVVLEESLQLLTCFAAIQARGNAPVDKNEVLNWCELIAASWLYRFIVHLSEEDSEDLEDPLHTYLDQLSHMDIKDLYAHLLEATALDRVVHDLAIHIQERKFAMLCICFYMKTSDIRAPSIREI